MTDVETKQLVEEVLQEVGLDSTYAFPIISTENANLLKLLGESKVRAKFVDLEGQEHKRKVETLKTHAELVKNQRLTTETLLLARERGCEAKHHEVCLTERQAGRFKQDIGQLFQRRKQLQDQLTRFENDNFNKSNQLNAMKAEIDCDHKLIEQYLEKCEYDVSTRERMVEIMHEGDSKLALLNAQAGRLSDKRQKAREKMNYATSKVDAMRLRIDAATARARDQDRKRHEILQACETVVSQMVKRDNDYEQMSEQCDRIDSAYQKEVKGVEEMRKIDVSIKEDVVETEKQMAAMNKEAYELRIDLQESRDKAQLLEGEVITLQNSVERTSIDYAKTVASLKKTKQELISKTDKLTAAEKGLVETENLVKEASDKTATVKQLAKLADSQLNAEEKAQRHALSVIDHLKSLDYKRTEELFNVRNNLKTTQTAVEGSETGMKSLQKCIDRKEMDLIKLEELIYKSEMFIQRLEKRIARVETDPIMDEKEFRAKENEVAELQSEFDLKTKRSVSLIGMINQFMNEKRVCRLRSEKLTNELNHLQDKLDTDRLILDSTIRGLTKIQAHVRQLLVNFNLAKFEVKKIQANLQALRDKTTTEEAHQLYLTSLEQEAMLEMGARIDQVKSEIHTLLGVQHDIKQDLNNRQRWLEQVKARYQVIAQTSGGEGSDGLNSRINILLERLAVRQDLKNRGDQLDSDVRQSEEEIRALENTVVVMNSLNDAAQSFTNKGKIDDEKAKQISLLTERIAEVDNAIADAREARRSLHANLAVLQVQDDDLTKKLRWLSEQCESTNHLIDKSQRALVDIREGISRCNRTLRRAFRSAPAYANQLEADIQVRLARHFNYMLILLYERMLKSSPNFSVDVLLRVNRLGEKLGIGRTSISESENAISRSPSQVGEWRESGQYPPSESHGPHLRIRSSTSGGHASGASSNFSNVLLRSRRSSGIGPPSSRRSSAASNSQADMNRDQLGSCLSISSINGPSSTTQ